MTVEWKSGLARRYQWYIYIYIKWYISWYYHDIFKWKYHDITRKYQHKLMRKLCKKREKRMYSHENCTGALYIYNSQTNCALPLLKNSWKQFVRFVKHQSFHWDSRLIRWHSFWTLTECSHILSHITISWWDNKMLVTLKYSVSSLCIAIALWLGAPAQALSACHIPVGAGRL